MFVLNPLIRLINWILCFLIQRLLGVAPVFSTRELVIFVVSCNCIVVALHK